MRHTEYLIIGQGVSGTFLSWYLQKAERSFIVIDNGDICSSSRIAAGIINPVTGRRIVKTWMIDTLLPFALTSYEQLGKELNIEAITQKNVIDFFPSPQMLNAFTGRLAEEPQYLSAPAASAANHYQEYFNYDFGYGEISPCYAVNLAEILPAWEKMLTRNNQLIEEDFQVSELSIQSDHITYRDIIAEKIIFCDGIHSAENPWFRNLPFALNKGEVLIIKNDALPIDKIFKKGMTIVPMKDKLFWVGSSYEWNFDDANPTQLFREKTVAQLNHWLKSSYIIEAHLASVRPAAIERRPFVGLHPQFPQIAVLNGMGTKGCSLAPWFANELVNNLINNAPILPEANINRFRRILQT